MTRPASTSRTSRRWAPPIVLTLAALVATLVGGPGAGAQAAATTAAIATTARSAYAANPDNPLAAGPWGVYRGTADGIYPAYQRATGTKKALLARIALQPRVRWFGGWMSAAKAAAQIRSYIAAEQGGNPDVLVQLAIFRLWPHGEGAKNRPITAAEQDAYRRWIDTAAQAIGGARVAIVLEPDLAVSLGGWQPSVRAALTAYAAHAFALLPRAAVYIDASDSDWLTVSKAADLLLASGIREARGFALGATHYSGTADNVAYGRSLVAALAAAGVPGRHFVIDTADNGRPFTWLQYWAAHPHGDFDNAETCRTTTQVRCDTLGIPPTPQVADARWGLSADLQQAAAGLVDGYLWFGRPWLYRQASPFKLGRALRIAATTPY